MSYAETLEIEIIQMWSYHQRIIYLVQLGDKYQMFYKSSGLTGHNSAGNILPCYLLKETPRSSTWVGDEWGGMPQGWIPKVYHIDNHVKPYYSKDEKDFPKFMQKIFNEIRELEKGSTHVTVTDDPTVINSVVRSYTDMEKLDWYIWE